MRELNVKVTEVDFLLNQTTHCSVEVCVPIFSAALHAEHVLSDVVCPLLQHCSVGSAYRS